MSESSLQKLFYFSLAVLTTAFIFAFAPKPPVAAKQLTVHVLVPLCDNENQGIVPVNKQLGDGLNLNTNLYWGAGYGVRSYFKLKAKWNIDTTYVPGGNVLQRVVFSKTINNIKVKLVADAYRGDAMNACMDHYFKSLAGNVNDSIVVKGQAIGLHSKADLLVFNGHNGLMDTTFALYRKKDKVKRQAAVIACASKFYFLDHFKQLDVDPLVTTTGLMAPEAYVLEALVTAWAAGKTPAEIRKACGNAYHGKHPKSSLNACIGLFHAGW